jgi:Arc/MetJ-type ribon-helix-helix transcriptional regulator
MRRINVTLDEETSKVLAGKANQSEVIREAVRMYHGGITTDTLAGMRAAFLSLKKQMQDLDARFTEQYEMVEKLYQMIEELTSR